MTKGYIASSYFNLGKGFAEDHLGLVIKHHNL